MSERNRPWRQLKMVHVGLLAVFVLASSPESGAQVSPPIGGDGKNVAVESTQKSLYAALRFVVVKTIDGVQQVVRFTKDLFVPGGKGADVDALRGIEEGSTVVVHYTLVGADQLAQEIDRVDREGLNKTEGVLERVDRKRQRVTIRFANGTRETLQLTPGATSEGSSDVDSAATGGPKVIVYFTDSAGHKIAHVFRRIP